MDFNKDTNISFVSQDAKNTFVLRLFEKDTHLLFVYRKLERVVSAFYLITNLFSDSEPIKWQFRDIGVNILSQTLSAPASPLTKTLAVNQMAGYMVRALSLLDISFVTGLVSEMNFNLLRKELVQLLEVLNVKEFSQTENAGGKVIFDKSFFELSAGQAGKDSQSQININSLHPAFPNTQKDGVIDAPEVFFNTNSDRAIALKGQKYVKDSRPALERKSSVTGRVAQSNPNREALILEQLKTKNNLTIKDFLTTIKGCSAKTVQRELLRLVKVGVLEKEGERRWSRYSLARR